MTSPANRVPSAVKNCTRNQKNRELARIKELEEELSKLKEELTKYLKQINHYQDLYLSAIEENEKRKDIEINFLKVAI